MNPLIKNKIYEREVWNPLLTIIKIQDIVASHGGWKWDMWGGKKWRGE